MAISCPNTQAGQPVGSAEATAITPTSQGFPFPGTDRKISFVLQDDIQAINGSQTTLAVQVAQLQDRREHEMHPQILFRGLMTRNKELPLGQESLRASLAS